MTLTASLRSGLRKLDPPAPLRLVLEAISTGLAAGTVIGLFRIAYTEINGHLCAEFLSTDPTPLKVAGAAAFVALCAAVALWTVRREPLCAGSGIPHVELAMAGKADMPWRRILLWKFLGTLASVSGGLSLGRGAPSVQMGAAVGRGVGGLWHEDGMRPRFLAGGSAAGLAAAFGAPWAGILFAFEELRVGVRGPRLAFMVLASASAWLVTDRVLGLGRIFPVDAAPWSLSELWLVPALGVACGLLCALYNRALLGLTALEDRLLPFVPRLLLAFGLAFAMLFVLPETIDGLGPGMGELSLEAAPVLPLLVLWGAKFLFNWASAASGSPGGILMPLLTAGGLTGALCASLLAAAGAPCPPSLPVLLCMAGFFAGIVRAPLTGAFLVAETTGNWPSLPALLAVALLAALTAHLLKSVPVFAGQLARQKRLDEKRKASRNAAES